MCDMIVNFNFLFDNLGRQSERKKTTLLVSDLFFAQSESRIFWKFEFLFHEDSPYTNVWIYCSVWRYCSVCL